MSIINCFSANTGLNIDGIVGSYYAYAGENISAGDFVEFINVYTTHPGQSNYFTQYTPHAMSACLIDENKFLLAYAGYGTNSNIGILKIGTVTSNSITFGVNYYLQDSVNDYMSISKFDTNKFIMAFREGRDIKAIACSISGSTITFGTSITIQTGTSSVTCSIPEVVPISTTNAIVTFRRTNIYGCVLTISNDLSVTKGTITTISSSSANYSAICKLSSLKFFVSYYESEGKAVIITISGTTISVNSTKYTFSTSALAGSRVCTLEESKVFIMFSINSTNVGKAIIANISGNTISFGNEVVVNDSQYGIYYSYDVCSLSSNKAVLAYSPAVAGGLDSTRTGLLQIATVSGSTIVLKNTLQFSSGYTSYPCILQSSGNVVILSYETYYNDVANQGFSRVLDCTGDTPSTDIIDSVETQVRNTTTSQFNGIAKTKGVGGDQIKVYVPDI